MQRLAERAQSQHSVVQSQTPPSTELRAVTEDAKKYTIPFSLAGIPVTKQFRGRSNEIENLEKELLPHGDNERQKVFVLYGMGGIGKTQLAVAFCRKHKRTFSAIFWFNGESIDTLKQSIVIAMDRIAGGTGSRPPKDTELVVKAFLHWLAQPRNNKWLIVFDNVDRDHETQDPSSLAYDVRDFFRRADHGSVLVTTRLARLEQIGVSNHLSKVDSETARAIFEVWFRGAYDRHEGQNLFSRLGGLPLAIAQAGAYLQESGIGLGAYLKLYDERWDQLVKPASEEQSLIQDYGSRGVWNTWSISFEAIQLQGVTGRCAANMLLLWSFLDRQDLWFELLHLAFLKDMVVAQKLSDWICNIADDQTAFANAIRLLRSYSMIETTENDGSYSTHPVVHKWMSHYVASEHHQRLAELSILVPGFHLAALDDNAYAEQRRVGPHVLACLPSISVILSRGKGLHERICYALDQITILLLALDRSREMMFMLEKIITEPHKLSIPKEYLSIFRRRLGKSYTNQGRFEEAEREVQHALQDLVLETEADYQFMFDTMSALGDCYRLQGKLKKAEDKLLEAWSMHEKIPGLHGIDLGYVMGRLGTLYVDMNRLDAAEEMLDRAIKGHLAKPTPDQRAVLEIKAVLGEVYRRQGRLEQAETQLSETLTGFKVLLGPEHVQTDHQALQAMMWYGHVLVELDRKDDAARMYSQALGGYRNSGDISSMTNCKVLEERMAWLKVQ